MFLHLKETEGNKSEGLGRLKQKSPSSMRRVKDHKKPEEIGKQRVIYYFHCWLRISQITIPSGENVIILTN